MDVIIDFVVIELVQVNSVHSGSVRWKYLMKYLRCVDLSAVMEGYIYCIWFVVI